MKPLTLSLALILPSAQPLSAAVFSRAPGISRLPHAAVNAGQRPGLLGDLQRFMHTERGMGLIGNEATQALNMLVAYRTDVRDHARGVAALARHLPADFAARLETAVASVDIQEERFELSGVESEGAWLASALSRAHAAAAPEVLRAVRRQAKAVLQDGRPELMSAFTDSIWPLTMYPGVGDIFSAVASIRNKETHESTRHQADALAAALLGSGLLDGTPAPSDSALRLTHGLSGGELLESQPGHLPSETNARGLAGRLMDRLSAALPEDGAEVLIGSIEDFPPVNTAGDNAAPTFGYYLREEFIERATAMGFNVSLIVFNWLTVVEKSPHAGAKRIVFRIDDRNTPHPDHGERLRVYATVVDENPAPAPSRVRLWSAIIISVILGALAASLL